MLPPEFDKEVVLRTGDKGRVVSFDHEALYVLWDDGDLIPITFADWDALVEVGDLKVVEKVPELKVPRKSDSV